VLEYMDWGEKLAKRPSMFKDEYDLFLGLLLSSLYLFSPQGRPGGIVSCTLGQGQVLLRSGVVTSTSFKTRKKYGYQPITLNETSAKLLKMYINEIRPRVKNSSSDRSSALWLRFDGCALVKLCEPMQLFFKKTLRLNICPTSCRSLVEMQMSQLYKSGKITMQQKEAVHNINGHTSQVCNDFYIHEDRLDDAKNARDAFNSLPRPPQMPRPLSLLQQPEDPPADFNLDLFDFELNEPELISDTWLPADNPVAADWGSLRDDYPTRKTDKKAVWTVAEVDYVGSWCSKTLRTSPHMKNIVAKCLKHIRSDPAAKPIFHELHVFDSARLRNGYRCWLDKHK